MTDTWNETSRTLPAGLTCAHCTSWTFCADKFGRKPEDTTCVWDPGRFRLKVELYQEAVAGLAAYREMVAGIARAYDYVGEIPPEETVRRKLALTGLDLRLDAVRYLLASPDPGQGVVESIRVFTAENNRLAKELDAARTDVLRHRGWMMDRLAALEKVAQTAVQMREWWREDIPDPFQDDKKGQVVTGAFDDAVLALGNAAVSPSPDPGQGILARLKAGEVLAKAWDHLRREHPGSIPAPHRTEIGAALATYDKAVTP